jgi:hypothetical protein
MSAIAAAGVSNAAATEASSRFFASLRSKAGETANRMRTVM